MNKMTQARMMSSYENCGRPAIDKSNFINEIDVYLASCGDKVKMVDAPSANGEITQVPVKDVKLPTIQGFAKHLNVSIETIYEYIKVNRDFSEKIKKIKIAQHEALISGGLSGRYNPVISKLLLSSVHKYTEKSTIVDPTHEDAPKSVDEEMENIIKEAERVVLNKDVEAA